MSRSMLLDFDAVINNLGGRDAYLSMLNNGLLLAISFMVHSSTTAELQRTAPSVFQNNPKLKEIFSEAVDLHNFDQARQYLIEILASQRSALRQLEPASSFRALFLNDYIGYAVDGLFRHLERCNKQFVGDIPGKYYSKHCSITQSSGTGKTRTIIEVGVVPITIGHI
ncbi:hypothetical protein BDV93DRAFT_131986 [Ceratobasidium sp. AG-I]|nr:hypothetical protein BDV93DRAFT_131986 [Ceratobasidium sp. AG-I]